MGTERPQADGEPGHDAAPQSAWGSRWQRWRTWLPFVLVIVSVYSSGAIGRLVPEDVIGLVRYLREHAAASAG